MKPLPDPFCTNDRSVVPSKSKAQAAAPCLSSKTQRMPGPARTLHGRERSCIISFGRSTCSRISRCATYNFLVVQIGGAFAMSMSFEKHWSIACFHPLEVCFHCMRTSLGFQTKQWEKDRAEPVSNRSSEMLESVGFAQSHHHEDVRGFVPKWLLTIQCVLDFWSSSAWQI